MSWLLLIGLLIVWELLARAGTINPIFYPPPTEIVDSLKEMLTSGRLQNETLTSLGRMFAGAAVGGSLGMVLGVTMGWSRRLRIALDPLIAALHPVPKMAVFPLVLMIFGFGEAPYFVMVMISSFFPMLVSSMAGVMEISPTHFEVARNYGAGRLATFNKVVIPGGLPLIISGWRLSLNSAMVIATVSEMRYGDSGLGSILWMSWATLRMEEMYIVIAILAMLGVGFNLFLSMFKKKLVPWH